MALSQPLSPPSTLSPASSTHLPTQAETLPTPSCPPAPAPPMASSSASSPSSGSSATSGSSGSAAPMPPRTPSTPAAVPLPRSTSSSPYHTPLASPKKRAMPSSPLGSPTKTGAVGSPTKLAPLGSPSKVGSAAQRTPLGSPTQRTPLFSSTKRDTGGSLFGSPTKHVLGSGMPRVRLNFSVGKLGDVLESKGEEDVFCHRDEKVTEEEAMYCMSLGRVKTQAQGSTIGRMDAAQDDGRANSSSSSSIAVGASRDDAPLASSPATGRIYPAAPPAAPTCHTIPLPNINGDLGHEHTRARHQLHHDEQDYDYPEMLEPYFTCTPVLGDSPFNSPTVTKSPASSPKKAPASVSSSSANNGNAQVSPPKVYLPARARTRPEVEERLLTREDVFPSEPAPVSVWQTSSESTGKPAPGGRASDPGARASAGGRARAASELRDPEVAWSSSSASGAGLGIEGLDLGQSLDHYASSLKGLQNDDGTNGVHEGTARSDEHDKNKSNTNSHDTTQAHADAARALNANAPATNVPAHVSTTANPSPNQNAYANPSSGTYTSTSQRTPNVYINGLPPHFPEDQLFALAAPFGEVRSVRTFTRHVRESESGYGFVLFETIDAAERCINALRKYPNLHPTFSKQIHKIPGTAYLHPSSISLSPSDTPAGGSSTASLPDDGESASFKAKMEALHDPTSTNLYMEGLPLSIDEPTLAALVSPHRISSSRFFQTRLSDPPRIIAFVRLETREGAEEIIERLHGRMVRGWNDAGSRISVRFADTSEQRELRRSERANKEGGGGGGEASPARITIAQAALLNLHGQDLEIGVGAAGLKHRGPAQHELQGLSLAALSTRLPVFEVDYNLVPPTVKANSLHASSPAQAQGRLPPTPAMDPAMAALLETLRHSGVPFHRGQSAGMENEYVSRLSVDQAQAQHLHHLYQQQPLQIPRTSASSEWQYGRSAHTRTGYTPAEEYIMRSHAEALHLHGHGRSSASGEVVHDGRGEYLNGSNAHVQAHGHSVDPHAGLVVVDGHEYPIYGEAQRRRPIPLDLVRREESQQHPQSQSQHRRKQDSEGSANIAMGVRGYRMQAAAIAFAPRGRGQQAASPAQDEGVGLPGSTTSEEDEFHTNRGDYAPEQHNHARAPSVSHSPAAHNSSIHPPHVNARLARGWGSLHDLTSDQRHQPPTSPQFSNTYQNAHVRSTTHPHQSSTQQHQHRHYQHNSMSISSLKSSIYDYEHESRLANNNIDNKNTSTTSSYSTTSQNALSHSQHAVSPTTAYQDPSNSNIYDPSDAISPALTASSLISPALSFSPQTPASTLSPSTPFFGSFGSGVQIAEGFAERIHGTTGIGMGIPDDVVQKKVRAGSH